MRAVKAPSVDRATTARAAIRVGRHTDPTGGLAPGSAQANLRPCPLLEVTDSGSPRPASVASDAPGHMFITDRPHAHYDSAARDHTTEAPKGHR